MDLSQRLYHYIFQFLILELNRFIKEGWNNFFNTFVEYRIFVLIKE